ncbi:response regulator [Vibrio coralliilyticus]|uniref:response regulator n=1 Tax=Vibrio coralliilyticus TaxID=190893 RepID=UPI0006CC4BE1|nr:response regulator [Vibrio coralliilyticus]AXN30800.1 response regulator [Vibrio coralliilyticus]KPH27184.1 histidine kinase [Vibrio coralliilyticus]
MKWTFTKSRYELHAVLALLAGLFLYLDLIMPAEVASGLPYIAIILLSMALRNQHSIVAWAIICTLLTLVGHYVTSAGNAVWSEIANRLLAISAIWVVTIVSLAIKDREQKLSKLQTELVVSDFRSTQGFVAEYARDAIVVTDPEGYTTWVNEGFVQLTGYQLDEIKGKKPGDVLQGPNTNIKQVQALSDAIKQAKQIDCELINYSKDGSEYWIDISIAPVFKDGVLTRFVAVERDITERKQLEEQLKKEIQLAKSAMENKSRFMRLINHELKVYSNSIVIPLKQIERSDDLSKIKSLATRLKHSGDLLHASIKHILTLSATDVDSLASKAEEIKLAEHLQSLSKKLTPLANGNDVNFSTQFNVNDSKQYLLDGNLLNQTVCFFALTTINQAPGGDVEVSAEVIDDRDSESLIVQIRSTDKGVSCRLMSELPGSPLQRHGLMEGICAGFHKVEALICQNGGNIQLSYTPEGHSLISIRVPLTHTENETPDKASNGTRILIAEDNQVNALILSKFLKGLGYYNIDRAKDGQEAVEMALAGNYEYIFMDNHMPRLTGLEATKLIIEFHNIPTTIIACTADTTNTATQQFYQYGAKEVLLKPVKKDALYAAMETSSQSNGQSVGNG